MSHDDFDFEPIPGLPAKLPDGERLLWQGSPDWKSLAVRAYHVRKIGLYFAGIAIWRIAVGVKNHDGVAAMAVSCAFILSLGAIAIAILALLAYLNSRSTVYSITSRRVLLRHGVAVPMTMNIPLKRIESADWRPYADGTGEIALEVPKDHRIGYLITWPHLRPGRFARPVPSFRALKGAAQAANILGSALMAETGADVTASAGAATSAVPSTQAASAAPVAARDPAAPSFAPRTAAA